MQPWFRSRSHNLLLTATALPRAPRPHALIRSRPSLKALLRRFRAVLLRSTAVVSAATAMLIASIAPSAAQVVPDGGTATTLAISGPTTDITTGTISQNFGVNSFSQFDVGVGQNVNVIAPGGTLGTVNIVNGSQSQINGSVRGVLGGETGGQLYIANPNGFVVGPNGTIAAGGVHLSTPSQAFVDGGVSDSAVGAIVSGTAPQGGGDIDVRGSIRGSSAVTLNAGGNISISGSVSADDRNAAMAAAVNGGSVRITAGGNIGVSGSVTAEGQGGGSGGTAYIYASGSAVLEGTGIVSVAARGSGDGGMLEFSAQDVVTLRGQLSASSDSGKAGTVYIDPNVVELVDTNRLGNGANVIIEALARVTVGNGVTISSRQVGGGNPVTGASTGDSGNIRIEAPIIEIGSGVNIVAHATDGFAAGDVSLRATWPTEDSPIGTSSIDISGAAITGKDVTIVARTVSHFAINYGSNPTIPSTEAYADALDAAGVPGKVVDALQSVADGGASVAQDVIDAYYNSPVIPGFAAAQSYVTVRNSAIAATGLVQIQSTAIAESDFHGSGGELRAAVAATLADAKTIIENSTIATNTAAFDGLTIGSKAVTDVNVVAQTAAVSFSLTDSLVAMRDSTVGAANSTAALLAETTEKQVIRAHQSDQTEAVATVFSVRAQQAQVLVDAEPGWTGGDSLIGGNNVAIAADAQRDFQFTADAESIGDDIATVGAVISVGSGATRAVIGGDVLAHQTQAFGGVAFIGANVMYSPYYSEAKVRGGTYADTSHDVPPWGLWSQDWLDAVKDLSEDVEAEAVDTADPSTAVTDAISYAIALNVEYAHDDVDSVLGGSFDGQNLGTVGALADGTVRVDSGWRLDNYFKRTDVRSDAGGGATAALSFGDWSATAGATIGSGATVISPDVVVFSDVTLPTISPYTLAALRSAGAVLGGVSFGVLTAHSLEAGELMPDLYSAVHPEDFNITNIVGAGVGGSALSLDIAAHNFTLTGTAEVADGAVLDVNHELQIESSASGNILSRSVDPDAADLDGVGTGAGGAIQILRIAPTVEAKLGAILAPPGTPLGLAQIGQLRMSALSGIVGLVYGGARANVDDLAIAGALSVVDYQAVTHAGVSADSSFIAAFTNIRAADQSMLAALAGGGAVGADGYGVAAAMVFADRLTVADISGFAADAVGTGQTMLGAGKGIVTAALNVEALDDSTTIAVAAAGGGVPGQRPDAGGLPEVALGTRSDEYESELGEQTVDAAVIGDAAGQDTGFSLAADFAGTFIKARTVAAVETAGALGSNLATIGATDLSDTFVSAGATLAGSGTSGLGGSLAMATVHAEQIALDRGGTRADPDNDGFMTLSIAASDLADLRVIAASRAGEHILHAGVATAVLVDTNSVTSATAVDVLYLDPLQLRTRGTADGVTLAIAGSLAPDVAEEAAEDEYDDGDPANDPPAAPDADIEQPRGTSVGITFLRLGASDTVSAGLIDSTVDSSTPRPSDANATSQIDVDAKNESNTVGFAVSLGAGGAWNVAATAEVVDIDQSTTATIDGDTGDWALAGEIGISATNDASVIGAIGAKAEGDTLAAGSSVIVIDDERETVAEISGATIAPVLPNPTSADDAPVIELTANATGIVQSYQKAGGGNAGDYGLAIMLGVIDADWTTAARVEDSSIKAWELSLEANERAEILNQQDGMASATQGAGAAGSVDTSHNSIVQALVDGSTLGIKDQLDLDVIGETIVTSHAVQSGTGKNNGGAVHSHYRGEGSIDAAVVDSTVIADFVHLSAYDLSWREIVANAATTADAIGLAGGLTVDAYKRNTSARIAGGSIATDDLELFVRSKTRTNNVAVGRANGNNPATIGVAAQVVWVVDDRDVVATITDAALDVDGDVDVTAERRDVYLMLQATAADSDKGVGIGAGVLLLGGATSALIDTDQSLDVTGGVTLTAVDYSAAVSLGFGAGSAGAFGGVGSFSLIEMGRRPADAEPLANNDRGADERDLSSDVRDSIFDLLRDEGDAAADEDTTRASRIGAVLTIADGDAEIGGDVAITALDSRAAVALTGELQAGGVSSALSYLDDYVRIGSLTTNGIEIGYRNIDLTATGDEQSIEIDFSKPWDPEEDDDGFPEGEEPLPPDEGEFPPGEEPLPPDGGDGGDGGGGDADVPGSDGVDEFLGETDGGDVEMQSGWSLGAAITRITLGGLVDAGVVVETGATLDIGGDLDLDATSTAETIGIAAGTQTSQQTNIGASAALVRQTQLVRARIDGGGEVTADTLDAVALSDGSAWSIGALLVVGGNVGIGATLSVNDMDAATEARIADATVTTRNAGGMDIDARDTSNAVSLAFSGGQSGGAQFNTSIGVNSSRSTASAMAIGADLTAELGDVHLRAVRDQSVTGLVLNLSIGSSVAVGAAIAIADMKGTALALVEDSTIEADDDVTVKADSDSQVASASVGVAASSSVGISGSISYTNKVDTTRAEINASDVTAGDSVLVQAQNGGALDGLGGGDDGMLGEMASGGVNIAIGSSAGIGVSVAVVNSSSVTEALITGNSAVTADGIGSDDGVNGIGRDSDNDRETVAYHGVAVVADNDTTVRGLAVTVAIAGTVAVSVQVPILLVEDTVRAKVSSENGRPDIESQSDISILAANDTSITTFSLVAAGASGVGVGADVEYLNLAKTTEAAVSLADLDAARDITLEALAPDTVSTMSIAGSFGTYVGVSGVVQVAVNQSETRAMISGGHIEAGDDLWIRALAPRRTTQLTIAAAGGIVGVGGSILVYNARDTIEAGTADAPGGSSSLVTTLDVAGDVEIEADSEFRNNPNVVAGSGGLVSVNAAILVTKFEQTVEARLGDYTTMADGRADNLTVSASQVFDQSLALGSLSGGYVGVGATIGYTSLSNSVLAAIGDHAHVDVSGDVTVHAYGEREVTGGALAIGGGLVALQASVLVVKLGKPGDHQDTGGAAEEDLEATDDQIAEIDGSLEGDDAYSHDGKSFSNGDDEIDDVLDRVLTGRRSVNVREVSDGAADTIKAKIGASAEVTAGSDITVFAEEGGRVDLFSGGANGGLVAVSGGVLVLNSGSTVQTEIGADAQLLAEAGDVGLKAESIVHIDNASAFVGNLGLVSVNGAVSNVETARAISVVVGPRVAIETLSARDIDIAVYDGGETRANTVSVAGGLVALGGTDASAKADTTLTIDFAGTGTVLKGGDVSIRADRDGDVIATAVGARGGVVAGNAVTTHATDTALASIDLGSVTIRNHDARTDIGVWNQADVRATSTGAAVGLAGVGAAIANATSSAWSEVVGSNVTIKSGELIVRAADVIDEGILRTISADVTSTAGGAISIVAGAAHATNQSHVEIDLGLHNLETFAGGGLNGQATFKTYANGAVRSESRGVNAGVVSGGANSSEIVSNTVSTIRVDFDGAASVDGTLTVLATGLDDATGNVRSGAGGGIVINGSKSTILVRPDTAVALIGEMVTARRVNIGTARDVTLDNNSDSRKISVVGIGGSRQETEADAESTVDLLLTIDATDITVSTDTAFVKNATGYNGLVGEGGLISGSSLFSSTTIANVSEINLAGATLRQGPNELSGAAGNVDIAVVTSYDLDDRLKIDTGGGILVPTAKSIVEIDAENAITLDDATVDATGAVSLAMTADVAVDNAAYVNVYGLAGSPSATATSTYTADQDIELLGASTITSQAAGISLSAGSKAGEGQKIDLSSETRIWNGTGLPLGRDLVADAIVNQSNSVLIGHDAAVLAATDVQITALGGSVDLYGYGVASNIYKEGAEDILNAFGSLFNQDDVSFDKERGRSILHDTNTVTVNGEVTGGAFATRILHIGANDQITQSVGDLNYSFQDNVNLYSDLEDYIAELEDEMEEFADDAALVTRLQFEIARLQSILLNVGNGGRADMVVIDDVFASGGNVAIDTELLKGSGDITANGDVLIEVLNESERVVEVQDVTIPIRTGGIFSYNGISVDSNNDIDGINVAKATAEIPVDLPPDPFPEAAFDITTSGPDGAQPRIVVRNDFIRDNANQTSGDLLVTGIVSNLSGDVQLATADGDVMVLGGEVNAKTVSISSGGDFFLSAGLDQLVTSTGSDPLGLYHEFFEDYSDWVDAGSNPATEPDFDLLFGRGQIVAVGSVFIYADFLNINGLVKSGVTEWSLEIDDTLQHRIDTANFSGTDPILLHAGSQTTSGGGSLSTAEDGDPLGDSIDEIIRNGISAVRGNVTVRWDPQSHELIVDPVVTQGGYVELVGKIISTGGGRIEAASGYGHLSVDSEADLPLVFTRVDTGPEAGVSGEIKIVDLARPGNGSDSFVITRYVKSANGEITRTISETAPPPGQINLPLILSGDATYAIAQPYAVTYTIGSIDHMSDAFHRTRSVTTFDDGTTLTTAGPTDVGLGNATRVDSDAVSTVSVDIFGATQLSNNPYHFSEGADEVESSRVRTYTTEFYDVATLVHPGFIARDQQRDGVETFDVFNYDSHRLAANYDIDVGFTGYANASVEIVSAGTIYIDGMFRNPGGETDITSTGGSVLTVGDATLETALTVIEALEGSVGRTGTIVVFDQIGGGSHVEKFGTSTLPMLIDQIDHRALDVVAGGVVRISEVNGDMYVRAVKSMDDATVNLSATGSILVSGNAEATGVLVRGGGLTLDAQSGRIGTAADPLRIGSDLLTAHAANDIDIVSTTRRILVNTVVSDTGDVSLTSPSFIRDGNDEQSVDRRAAAGLLDDLWDDIGLRNNGSSTRLTDAIVRLNEQGTADYFRYWETRGLVVDGAGTVTGVEPYDPQYAFSFTADERTALLQQGLTPLEITAQEAARTAEFHDLNARFGAGTYDPAFHYVATLPEIVAATRQIYWSDNQLNNSIRESLAIDSADTDFVIETPNIVGHDVTLDAGTSIGEQTGTLTIPVGYTPTPDAILALNNAEPSDIIVTPFNAFVDIYDDLDIVASGELVAGADNNILVSSEGVLTIAEVSAPLTVRLKSAQGIIAGDRIGGQPHVRASTLVLEGGTGGVGAIGSPITLGTINALTARATGDVIVMSPLGNIDIAQILSLAGDARVSTPFGSIGDHNLDDEADIVANGIYVAAGLGVGEANNALDVQVTSGGVLSVLATLGDVFVGVPTGDALPTAIGSLQGNTTISVAAGDLVLTGIGAPVIATGGTATLNVHGNIVGPATLQPQIAAGSGLTLSVSGEVGAANRYIVTAIAGATSAGARINITDTNVFASGIYLANAGHLSIETIDLNGHGVLKLANTGDLHFADNSTLDGGDIDVAVFGTGNDAIFDRNMTLTRGTLRVAAAGDIDIAGNGNIDFGGDTTLVANRMTETSVNAALIGMTNDDALTILTQHGIDIARIASDGLVTLRALDVVGGVELDNVRASTLTVSTYLGDVHIGDAIALDIDIDAHGNVDGTYEAAQSLDIWSSAGIGVAAADNSAPLVIESISTASVIHLSGELGVNVRVGGPGNLTFTGIETAVRGDGAYVDGGGNIVLRLADAVPPLPTDDLRGIGVIIDAPLANVTIGGTGIDANGTSVSITTVGTLSEANGAVIDARDLAIDAGSLGNPGPDGLRTRVEALALNVAAGDAHIRNDGDLLLASATTTGNLDLFVDGTLDIGGGIAAGDAVLTATGNLTGTFTALSADEVQLTALGGAIDGLDINLPTVRRYRVYGAAGVELTIAGSFGAGYVISGVGDVGIHATGAIEIGTVGTPDDAVIGGSSVVVARYGSATPIATLPAIANVISPTSYPVVVAAVPSGKPPVPPVPPVPPTPPVVPPVVDPPGDTGELSPVVRARLLQRLGGGATVNPPGLRTAIAVRQLGQAIRQGVRVRIANGLPGGQQNQNEDDEDSDE